MVDNEWTTIEDEYGTWKVMGDVRIPIEPSPKYIEFKQSLDIIEPNELTQEDFMLDLEFRMSKLEMGM